jgi:hypothetical protein
LVCSAVAGALWKEAVWALIGKHAPIATNRNTDRDTKNADLLLFQLALLAASKVPSQGLIDSHFRGLTLLAAVPTRIILPLQSERSKSGNVHGFRCAP